MWGVSATFTAALTSTGCRTCADAYGPDEAWRCFFAQYAHAHVATPALFHEYLYDSANLGFDGATSSNFSSFREHLEASFTGSAAGGPDPVTLGFSGVAAGAAAARAPASAAPAAAPLPDVQEPYRVDAYGVQAASTGRALLVAGGGAGAGTAAGGLPASGKTLSSRSFGTAGAPSSGVALAAGTAHEGRAAAARM